MTSIWISIKKCGIHILGELGYIVYGISCHLLVGPKLCCKIFIVGLVLLTDKSQINCLDTMEH